MGNYYGLLTYDDSKLTEEEQTNLKNRLESIAKSCGCYRRDVDEKNIPKFMSGVAVKPFTKVFYAEPEGVLSSEAHTIYRYKVHDFLIEALNYLRKNTSIEKYEIYVQERQDK